MSTTLTLTLPPPTLQSVYTAPTPRLWTAKEFDHFGELGLFENQRAILIDGIIWELGPMNPPHAIALELLDIWTHATFPAGSGWRIRNQSPLHLNALTNPMPDIAIYRGSPRDGATHPKNPELVIEVSDSSLTFDLTVKAEKNAEAGVPDFWVLDLETRKLLVFRDPQHFAANGNSYRTQLTFGPEDSVSPLAAPQASVRVADLLP